MNNRLSLTDLASLLATATSKNKRDTELFLRTLIVLITRQLFQDKLVKVKGLGTFKLIQVEARESVRVQTGERFVIPAHYKFTFVPDKEIKDRVNKPFSFFEVTELNRQVEFPDLHESEEDETVESDDASVEELSSMETPNVQTVPDLPPLSESGVNSSSGIPEEISESSVASNSSPETVDSSDTSVPDASETPSSLSNEQQEPSVVEAARRWSWVRWLVLLVVLAGGVGGWFVNRQTTQSGAKQVNDSIQLPVPQPSDSDQPATMDFPAEATVSTQTPASDVVAASVDSVAQPSDALELASDSVLAHVQIAVGDRLTTIALQYYGHKIFWVYLYEYNKDHIDNPNNIPIGTDIAIPAPQLYGIDAQNAISIREATRKQTEILGKMD